MDKTAVWVGNLDPKAIEGDVNELFKDYADFIVSTYVQRDKVTKESRGFAFVNFNNRQKAAHAVRQINDKVFRGKKLKVNIKQEARSSSAAALSSAKQLPHDDPAPLPKDLDRSATLWVGSLPRKATEAEVREVFSLYRGSISSVRIMRDEKDKRVSRGFGFINFTNARHAHDALQNFQGHHVHGLPIKLSLKHDTGTDTPSSPSSPRDHVPAVRVIEKPAAWERQDKHIVVKDVGKVSTEWNDIEEELRCTLPNARISTIKRIQNVWLWEKYIQHRQRMREKNSGRVNEMQLFHGMRMTDPKCIFMSEEGFDMRFSRKGLWGRGNYFATKASYSDVYAHELRTGEKQIFLVSVLTGESYGCCSDSSLTMPPIRENSTKFGAVRYDTVTGVTQNTKVYITYSNDKAYPTYLITYRIRSRLY